MDGATKFVKGDAIMSIIITFINFIAGTVIGIVQSGNTFAQVLNIYSIATVGDGLVSQIPALLISTATGKIVTRRRRLRFQLEPGCPVGGSFLRAFRRALRSRASY
jgi:flagellar biosynthesis component FlhA